MINYLRDLLFPPKRPCYAHGCTRRVVHAIECCEEAKYLCAAHLPAELDIIASCQNKNCCFVCKENYYTNDYEFVCLVAPSNVVRMMACEACILQHLRPELFVDQSYDGRFESKYPKPGERCHKCEKPMPPTRALGNDWQVGTFGKGWLFLPKWYTDDKKHAFCLDCITEKLKPFMVPDMVSTNVFEYASPDFSRIASRHSEAAEER